MESVCVLSQVVILILKFRLDGKMMFHIYKKAYSSSDRRVNVLTQLV